MCIGILCLRRGCFYAFEGDKLFLTKLELVNFRNYRKCSLKLSKSVNIFIGNNGQGKTNILEAIYVLAVTKSHRFGEQENLIKKEEQMAKVKGTLKFEKIYKDLEVDIGKNQKNTYINKTEIRKKQDFITNLNVILFTPDDLEIIKGVPQVRRNILNIEISQMDKNYIKYLNEYNKILKNRNEYLKSLYINHLSDYRYLDVLTEKLIDRAVMIYKYRMDFLARINSNIGKIYESITGYKNLCVVYQNSLDIFEFDEEKIRSSLRKKLKKHQERELQQGSTLYGPHRDDFSFYLGDDNVRIFSSQGGQRLAVIAFKLAEISIFKEKTGQVPILLLDDIFSEIDSKKKRKLISFIPEDVQTIITTTDLKNINKKLLENSKIFEVFCGNIRERE